MMCHNHPAPFEIVSLTPNEAAGTVLIAVRCQRCASIGRSTINVGMLIAEEFYWNSQAAEEAMDQPTPTTTPATQRESIHA